MQRKQATATNISFYDLQCEIGRGASSVCYKAVSKLDRRVYAIKRIGINCMKENSLQLAMRQVNVLKSLSHPNIIQYHESFADDQDLYIVMQYASKGDLHSILKRRSIKQQFFSETELWSMMKQLLEAISYLHSKNIIHRDIKTLNIFMSESNSLLVGDLGVSKILKNDLGVYSRVGTPLYLAPEIIKYEKYDFKADIWGLGCVAYFLSTLTHPFAGKNIISLGQNIVKQTPKPITLYSEEYAAFVMSMLEKKPASRADAKILLQTYFHKKGNSNAKDSQFETKNQTQNNSQKCGGQCQNKKRIAILDFSSDEFEQKQKVSPSIADRNEPQPKKIGLIKSTNKKSTKSVLSEDGFQKDSPLKNNFIKTSEEDTILHKPEKNRLYQVCMPHERTQQRSSRLQKEDGGRKLEINQSLIQSKDLFFQNEGRQLDREKIATEDDRREGKVQMKRRQIKSAKPAPAVSENGGQIFSSCKNLNKELIKMDANRMMASQEGCNNKKERPKSSLGRGKIIAQRQLKYIKKRTNDFSFFTKTELLKKPQMIIIL